jgi:hypothetical protein
MRREIQYGRCRLQLERRLGVATPFRLVLVIEGPDARPADLSNRVIKCGRQLGCTDLLLAKAESGKDPLHFFGLAPLRFVTGRDLSISSGHA